MVIGMKIVNEGKEADDEPKADKPPGGWPTRTLVHHTAGADHLRLRKRERPRLSRHTGISLPNRSSGNLTAVKQTKEPHCSTAPIPPAVFLLPHKILTARRDGATTPVAERSLHCAPVHSTMSVSDVDRYERTESAPATS